MKISVVIPTYNRKRNLLVLLNNLNNTSHPVAEVIIVDAGDDRLSCTDYALFPNLVILHLLSAPSVCIQRNTGIEAATSEWIFLCDDDIEVPHDYLQKINDYAQLHPDAGAMSGMVLQQEKGHWTGSYPIRSKKELMLKYIFGLSIWGEIKITAGNAFAQRIEHYYTRKGNHIARSGWPVITDFSGDAFIVPVFGLGASVVRKQWLLQSPYDEMLDRYGIGDNYGVSIGFPGGIHILNNAFVYHHQEAANRLKQPLQYYRRVLALDYFIRTRKELQQVSRLSFLWSLLGNVLIHFTGRNWLMANAALKTLLRIVKGRNPYQSGAARQEKAIEPVW